MNDATNKALYYAVLGLLGRDLPREELEAELAALFGVASINGKGLANRTMVRPGGRVALASTVKVADVTMSDDASFLYDEATHTLLNIDCDWHWLAVKATPAPAG